MLSDLVEGFREAVADDGIPNLSTELEASLWVLAVAEDVIDVRAMTANEIAQVVLKVLRSNTSWQRVTSLLDAEPKLAIRKKNRGRRPATYTITKVGRERVSDASDEALLVQPETGLSGVRRVESMFAELSGSVRVCDPYLDSRSLDFLAQMWNASSLSVLTQNVKNESKIKSELKLLRSQLGIDVDVRVAQARTLHDRYAIDDDSMIILGTSLNGLGLKQTIVVEVGEDLRAITLAAFERLFNAASSI